MTSVVGKITPLGESSVEWEIEKFNYRSQELSSDSLEWTSPIFELFETRWHFSLYQNRSMTHYCISLVMTHCFNGMPVMIYEIGIKGYDGNICNRFKVPVRLPSKYFVCCRIDASAFPSKYALAMNRPVTFFCNVFKTDKANVASQASLFDDDIILNQNLADMFLKERSCDVLLKIGKNEFKAHKFMLTARSEVFASMFEHNMSETRSGIVNIEDCDPIAFQDFLLYLYTAKIDFKTTSPEKMLFLYCIAHKYQVLGLRNVCVNFLAENISVDNFCDVLALALKYDENELISSSENLFLKKARDILLTEKWQSFHKENVTVANDLFVKYTEKN